MIAASPAERLIAAARAGDPMSFGTALAALVEREDVAAQLAPTMAALRAALPGWLVATPFAEAVEWPERVSDLVGTVCVEIAAFIEVNAVVLEHVVRAATDHSGIVGDLDPLDVIMFAALLAGRLDPVAAAGEGLREHAVPSSAAPASPPAVPEAVEAALETAVAAVAAADAAAWRAAVEVAVAADSSAADRCARDLLRAALNALGDATTRLADQLGTSGPAAPARHAVSDVATISELLALLVAESPDLGLACPAYLFELTIRRALGEPGCEPVGDLAEVIFAATEAAGLLQLCLSASPPGWTGYLIDARAC